MTALFAISRFIWAAYRVPHKLQHRIGHITLVKYSLLNNLWPSQNAVGLRILGVTDLTPSNSQRRRNPQTLKFPSGQVAATPGALAAFLESGKEFTSRYDGTTAGGPIQAVCWLEWGSLGIQTATKNWSALENDFRTFLQLSPENQAFAVR